jgi:hypothetical protein
MAIITIFGTSDTQPGNMDYDNAENLGKILTTSGFDIATGGYSGIMEAALKGASYSNAKRYGVTTATYPDKLINEFVTIEHKTNPYQERLNKLIEIGDGFAVFPGGTGTLLEFATVWALAERDLLGNKPIVCLGEQWYEIIELMGFYSEKTLEGFNLVKFADSVDDAAGYLTDNLKI